MIPGRPPQIDLTDLKVRYFSLLVEREAEVRTALSTMASLAPGRGQAAALVAAGVLHKLAGSSAMLGFTEIGEAARVGEEQILDWVHGRGATRSDALAAIAIFLDVAENARTGQ